MLLSAMLLMRRIALAISSVENLRFLPHSPTHVFRLVEKPPSEIGGVRRFSPKRQAIGTERQARAAVQVAADIAQGSLVEAWQFTKCRPRIQIYQLGCLHLKRQLLQLLEFHITSHNQKWAFFCLSLDPALLYQNSGNRASATRGQSRFAPNEVSPWRRQIVHTAERHSP